jgi:molecular chaperone GrpE
VHEAIQQVPSDDHEPMTVIEEVEQGFRLGDRVVRPARVIVSMASPVADAETPDAETTDAETPDAETPSEEN